MSLDLEAEARARLRHDLQARLTVIVGYADLLQTRDDEDIRRDGLQRILEAAQLLSRDIDALFGETATAAPAGEARPERSRTRTILVVDDDEQIRGLLKLTLLEADFDVREASGGPEALPLIEAERPALVLLDWQMPARPGAEVLEELKRRWAELPVVVLTAEPRAGERERAESLGADAFLRKPVSRIELLETIQGLLAEGPRDEPA